MAGELKLRRGTTQQHEVFTGAQAEVTVDTDTNSLVVHDGVTPGGFRVPNEEAFSAGDVAVSGFSGGKYEAIASGNTLTISGTPVDELTGEPKFHVGRRLFCEGAARTITEVTTDGGNTVVTVDGAALSVGSVGVYLGSSLGAIPEFDALGAASEAVSEHESATDPHPQYAPASEFAAFRTSAESDLSDLRDDVGAALAGQSASMIGYATKASMSADTSQPVGTLALVTNDPNPANNGAYRWDGVSWVASEDRVSGLEARVGSLESTQISTYMVEPGAPWGN